MQYKKFGAYSFMGKAGGDRQKLGFRKLLRSDTKDLTHSLEEVLHLSLVGKRGVRRLPRLQLLLGNQDTGKGVVTPAKIPTSPYQLPEKSQASKSCLHLSSPSKCHRNPTNRMDLVRPSVPLQGRPAGRSQRQTRRGLRRLLSA